MRYARISLVLCCWNLLCACTLYNPATTTTPGASGTNLNIAIPTAGNSWGMSNGEFISVNLVTAEGVRNWNNPSHTIRTFFYVAQAGPIALGVRARVAAGVSRLKFNFRNTSQEITLTGTGFRDTYIGDFQVDYPGYYYVDLTGGERTGAVFADVDQLLVGSANPAAIKFARDDFYFARRGPSVHLNFGLPDGVDQVEWFYSQLTIPANQDVVGSYFMANGFGEGYFGIQVNSATERKILFSIWSPYQTDDPTAIPAAYKVRLLRKGEGVTTGEFGNEGSGGQSFKSYNWKTGVTYGFLVGARPTGEGHTDYSAYFFDPAINQWSLIAQFRRPQTHTYLKNLYSFLENFIPAQGVYARKGLYQNQWVFETNTGWHELTQATFTADDTARKGYRRDYSGGTEGQGFYLKNCGFTSDQVAVDTPFERKRLRVPPQIDFTLLE